MGEPAAARQTGVARGAWFSVRYGRPWGLLLGAVGLVVLGGLRAVQRDPAQVSRVLWLAATLIALGLSYRIVLRDRTHPWRAVVFQRAVRPWRHFGWILAISAALLVVLLVVSGTAIALLPGTTVPARLLAGAVVGGSVWGLVLLCTGFGISSIVSAWDALGVLVLVHLSVLPPLLGQWMNIPPSVMAGMRFVLLPLDANFYVGQWLLHGTWNGGLADVVALFLYPLLWIGIGMWRVRGA